MGARSTSAPIKAFSIIEMSSEFVCFHIKGACSAMQAGLSQNIVLRILFPDEYIIDCQDMKCVNKR